MFKETCCILSEYSVVLVIGLIAWCVLGGRTKTRVTVAMIQRQLDIQTWSDKSAMLVTSIQHSSLGGKPLKHWFDTYLSFDTHLSFDTRYHNLFSIFDRYQ